MGKAKQELDMALEQDPNYGFAGHDAVEQAVNERLASVARKTPEHAAALLGEAVAALLAVNSAIPVHSNQRHLVAEALEKFADGSTA